MSELGRDDDAPRRDWEYDVLRRADEEDRKREHSATCQVQGPDGYHPVRPEEYEHNDENPGTWNICPACGQEVAL